MLLRITSSHGALLAALWVLTACQSSGASLTEIAPEINLTHAHFEYTVQVGDTLSVQFPKRPEWNHESVVLPDGTANFLFVDGMPVVGRHLEELDLELTIETIENSEFQEADLTLSTTKYAPRNVLVLGEVEEPGPVPIELGDHITLLEALARSGGHLKPTAHLESLLLVRWHPVEQRTVAWKIDASVEEWGTAEPVWLQHADVVFVPNTTIDDVNIWVDQYIRRMIPIPLFWID